MAKIKTKEEFNKLPNGTRLKLFCEGDDWDDDCGEVFNVIKVDNKLFQCDSGFWDFKECNDEGYEFSLVKPSPNERKYY